MTEIVVGRLAPSPTGLLHVGNLRSLAAAWLAARAAGGRVFLRIEDLMPNMAPHIAPLLADLRWAGLDWDAPPAGAGMQLREAYWLQSARHELYAAVIGDWLARGVAYPCVCTRKDIDRAALAPHAEDAAPAYPGLCRGRFASLAEAEAFERQRAASEGRAPLGVAVRARVPDGTVGFDDAVRGPQRVDVAQSSGDIVIRRKDGGAAYMLAVVLDDDAMGVTQVVRGDDLLEVTGQQIALGRLLRGQSWHQPEYAHVPLVIGDDGRRLAKRNQSLQLRALREAGVAAAKLRGWLLESLGLGGGQTWQQAARDFAWSRVPLHPVRFGPAEQAELLRAVG